MVSNLLRCFDIRHGRRKEDEAPSPRYSSPPQWGPAKGLSHRFGIWDVMRERSIIIWVGTRRRASRFRRL